MRRRIDHPREKIHHKAIYHDIYYPQNPERVEMIQLLHRDHKKRKNNGSGRKVRKTKFPNRISIEARPKSVVSRCHAGHWEGDSLISRKSKAALNTLAERKEKPPCSYHQDSQEER